MALFSLDCDALQYPITASCNALRLFSSHTILISIPSLINKVAES